MKSAVIVFPGSNRDKDAADALEKASGVRPLMVWHGDSDLPKVDLVMLPGGFSYGDYLRAGAMAARSPIMRAVIDHANAGRAVLGVCNGFQILCEAGLLPGVLMRNAGLKFVCRDVHLRIDENASIFTSRYGYQDVVRTPVAHHDGCWFSDDDVVDRLEGEELIAFRYVTDHGGLAWSANPNGSVENIAGILNESRNVLGMMPHPENAIDEAQGSTDGLKLFESLAHALG